MNLFINFEELSGAYFNGIGMDLDTHQFEL